MFLYVTERINSYHKIGIADNVYERLNNFRTLIPDLNFSFYIPLPNRKTGELFERTLKKHLKVYRLKKSECYGLTIESIKRVITGYTILINYCVIDYNINPIDYPYELSQFDDSRVAWETSRKTSVIFLNEIYFGEKIPLFAIQKNDENGKIKIKAIDKLNSIEELGDLCSKLDSVFERYKVSLKNPLFEYLKDNDNNEINIKEYTLPIIEYFSPIVWKGLVKYLNNLKEINEMNNVKSINKNSSIYQNFPFDCLNALDYHKKIDMDKCDVIPNSFLIDITKLNKIGSLFGKS